MSQPIFITPNCFRELVSSFLKTMEQTGADFTNSFRCLSRLPLPSSSDFTEKLATVKNYLLSQCCTAEDLKKASSPRMDPRYVHGCLPLPNSCS